jgi:hypothetical protein
MVPVMVLQVMTTRNLVDVYHRSKFEYVDTVSLAGVGITLLPDDSPQQDLLWIFTSLP